MIYADRYEALYNFMTELSFKALRPERKELKIPDLDQDKKNRLNSILKEMREDINNF